MDKTAALALLFLLSRSPSVSAQTFEVKWTNPGDSRQFNRTSFDGTTLEERFRGNYVDAVNKAAVANIDLDAATIGGDNGHFVVSLPCRSSVPFCVHNENHRVD